MLYYDDVKRKIITNNSRVNLMIQDLTSSIYFEKVSHQHQENIFTWLAEPHMQEFWDNSQEHKDDIINFINGRVIPPPYFGGIFTYWIGIVNNEPFSLILTAEVHQNDDCEPIWKEHISKTGKTYSIDFGIGNKNYLGQGLAAATLKKFTVFFQDQIDLLADTFFIDPNENNPRAKHVYEKAGFKSVGEYATKEGVFKGQKTFLMVMNP